MRKFGIISALWAGSGNSAIELTCEELAQYAHSLGWVDVCKGWQEA